MNAEVLSESHDQKRRKRSVDDLETIEVAFVGDDSTRGSNSSVDVRNDVFRESTDNLAESGGSRRRFRDGNRHFRNRTRRILSAQRGPELVTMRPYDPPRRYLHFNVSVFGTSLQLRVEKKQTLIAPGAKSIIFFEDGRRIEKVLSSSCLFFGTIPNYPRSKVAISNCNGLVSLLLLEKYHSNDRAS